MTGQWAVPAHRRNWLTVQEACQRLYMSERGVLDRLHTGRIVGHKRLGMWQISAEAIDECLKKEGLS